MPDDEKASDTRIPLWKSSSDLGENLPQTNVPTIFMDPLNR